MRKIDLLTTILTESTNEFVVLDFFKMGEVMTGMGEEVKGKVWMDKNFQKKILADAPLKISHTGGIAVGKFLLNENMSDRIILGEISGAPIYTISEFLGIIHTFITKKYEGVEEGLIANGYAPLFYVYAKDGSILVVLPFFNKGNHWYFVCYEFESHTWLQNRVVYAPPTLASGGLRETKQLGNPMGRA